MPAVHVSAQAGRLGEGNLMDPSSPPNSNDFGGLLESLGNLISLLQTLHIDLNPITA